MSPELKLFGIDIRKAFKSGLLKRYLVASAMLAVILGLIIFVFIPTLQQVRQVSEKINTARTSKDDLQKNVENIQKAQRVYKKQQDSLELIKLAIPSSAKPITFLNELDLQVANHNLALRSLSFSGSSEKKQDGNLTAAEGLQTNTFNLQVSGSYPDLRNFLKTLETLPRLTSVTSVRLSQPSRTGSSTAPAGALTLSVSGKFYYHVGE